MTRSLHHAIPRPSGRLLTAAFLAAAVAWSGPAVFTQAEVADGVNCDSDDVCTIKGSFTADVELDADNEYRLIGAVFIEEPAILEIEAGTTIYGDSATRGTLVIARGARIHARGTAAAPIVMTSDRRVMTTPAAQELAISSNTPQTSISRAIAVAPIISSLMRESGAYGVGSGIVGWHPWRGEAGILILG